MALQAVRDVLSAVDAKVNEHEQRRRLEELAGCLEPRASASRKDSKFGPDEMLARRLLHDGPLQAKVSNGRLKGRLSL